MTTSKLTAFLKKNKKTKDTFELKLDSFDEPIQLRIISGGENEAIQKKCMRTVKIGRKAEKQFDNIEYQKLLAINSITYPPLDSTELQESYGVIGARDLYDSMFNFAEQSHIVLKISDESGLDQDINDERDEAKN